MQSEVFVSIVSRYIRFKNYCNDHYIKGYDGICNLSSVETYNPETDQWTMVAPMCAHEGVVGVSVLPADVDLPFEEEKRDSQHFQQQSSTTTTKTQVPFQNNRPLVNNYYSLMEGEEEEYVNMISPSTFPS